MSTVEPTITCPKCKNEIRLTESLAAPLIAQTREKYEEKLAQKDAEVSKREAALRSSAQDLEKAREQLTEQIEAGIKEQRSAIAEEEKKKARAAVASDLELKSTEIEEIKEVMARKDAKLAEAQKAQAELLRKQRELDDQKRELELTVEKKIQEGISVAREQAKKQAEDDMRMKVVEKEQLITTMQRQIEDLKRRAEQGSQQLQGEVQEIVLEEALQAQFPQDQVVPVPKGEHGGDVLHRVIGPAGQTCGTILWESKRTKTWSDGWLAKLREDQRSAKAEVAIIVSQALPAGIDTFSQVDGVWVVAPQVSAAVAIVLRHHVVELAAARQAGEGQQTKTELVYQYLTGPAFRHRVEAIVEKFTDMRQDLDRERKQMMRLWAKREQQIIGVIDATAGMYGDLQGIAGRSLQEIEGLSLPQLSDERQAPETRHAE